MSTSAWGALPPDTKAKQKAMTALHVLRAYQAYQLEINGQVFPVGGHGVFWLEAEEWGSP